MMIWHDLLLCYFSHLIKSSCLPSCVVFQWFPAHNCPRSKTVQPHGFCSGNHIEFNARDSNIVGPNCTELSGPEGFLMALVPVTGSFTSLNITATECHWNMSRLNLFESIWIFSDSAAGYWPELAKICKDIKHAAALAHHGSQPINLLRFAFRWAQHMKFIVNWNAKCVSVISSWDASNCRRRSCHVIMNHDCDTGVC